MSTVIVVGVDGRGPSRDAVALGAALATVSGGEVVLAHVHPYDALGHALTGVLRQEASALLREAAKALPHPVRTVPLAASSPARGLHAVAEQEEAELLVVGSTHRGRAGRVMLGSQAEATIAGAPCAVAVAPRGLAEDDWALRRIAVGFDGGPEAREALALARRLAAESGAALRLCGVATTAMGDWSPYAHTPDWDDVLRQRAKALEAQLRSVADGAQTEVRSGDAVDELVAVSRESDLLALGSRAYGPVRRVLLGATAHRVVREAACPVLVVPRSATTDRLESSSAEATTSTAS